MTNKARSLVRAAESITPFEMAAAPELPTLAALDANLLATTTMLRFQYPSPGQPSAPNRDIADRVEDHVVDVIYTLATALRSALAAYYAAVQDDCDTERPKRNADADPF
jgi:hypothetical protein